MTFPVLDWHLNEAYAQRAYEALGRIPLIFNPQSADPAWQQITDNYPGGFNPQAEGWSLLEDDYLVERGQPPLTPMAMAWLRDERIIVYDAGWCCIVQANGDFTVVRIEP